MDPNAVHRHHDPSQYQVGLAIGWIGIIMRSNDGERERRTIWVRMVVIVQTMASGAALRAIIVSVVGLRWVDIIVIILSGIKVFVQVGRSGRRRVAVLTAGAMMASSHDDGGGGN